MQIVNFNSTMSVNSCCVPGCAVVKIDVLLTDLLKKLQNFDSPEERIKREPTRRRDLQNKMQPHLKVVSHAAGVPLHSFPNPVKSAEKFKTWVFNIGGEIAILDHHIISQNRRVCHRHFEEIHKYPTGRLSKLAIPTLHIPDLEAESLGEAMGSAFDCAPLIVTGGSSPSLQTKIQDPMPELSHFITDIKSELDPVEMKEDPQSEVAVSYEEDQQSNADQPCEDLIPLSNDQVLLTNAQDPLTEVKVEEPELTVDEMKVKVEAVEVTGPELQVTRPWVPTAQVPLLERHVLRSASDNADLIRTQSQQIAKLTARCNHTQRQLNNMVELLRRRDNTISCLRAERDELATCLAGRAGTGGGTGGGRIQIQSVNNIVEEKKPNRKLFIVKRVRKSFVRTQPTSVSVTRTSRTLQNTSENGQKTSELKRTLEI